MEDTVFVRVKLEKSACGGVEIDLEIHSMTNSAFDNHESILLKDVYFAQQSLTLDQSNNLVQVHKPRNHLLASNFIVCGGGRTGKTKFQYYVVNESNHDNNASAGTFLSMNEYHGYKHADLKFYGTKTGQNLHTLITDDGFNIIVMEMFKGYNVYNIKSDSWLLKENILKGIDFGLPSGNGRCLFLRNQLLISSENENITILDLNDIAAPKKIFEYKIKSEIDVLLNADADRQGYICHGMCLINYSNNTTSFLLFGNSNEYKHYNVIKMDMVVSQSNRKWKIESIKDEIVHNAPIDKFPNTSFSYLPFCITDKKKQRNILMVNGEDLYLYNYDNNVMSKKQTVK